MLKHENDSVHKNTLELQDCQCEIVLKSLEYYCYSANFLYDRHRKYTSREDELKISLITDTYHQILNQFTKSTSKNKITNLEKVKKVS